MGKAAFLKELMGAIAEKTARPQYKVRGGLSPDAGETIIKGQPSGLVIPGSGRVAARPIKEIEEAAGKYMEKIGRPGDHLITEYPEFDEDFARRVAAEYDKGVHAPKDPKVKRSYEALMDETLAQYRALDDAGIDIKFIRDGKDPYAASPAMGYQDIIENGRLWMFPTDNGFGSSAFDVSENPLLTAVGRVGDKDDAVANDAFRVVHDAFGHYGPGNPYFRHKGEDRAFLNHARMYSEDALPAAAAELRGQNSWLNFGPHGEKNRTASGEDTIFADQKNMAMPDWVFESELKRRKGYNKGGVVKKLMRLYHGTKGSTPERATTLRTPEGRSFEAAQGFEGLSPNISPEELGLHLGSQKQANTFGGYKPEFDDPDLGYSPGYLADNAPVHGRVIPLDVDVQSPLRLQDKTGNWAPDEIYRQLVEQGKITRSAEEESYFRRADDPREALAKIRKKLEELGHDGVVYKNRYETGLPPNEAYKRAKAAGVRVDELNDDEFSKLFPEAEDSYIVWNRDKYRSPFGEGTGAGFAEGGEVDDVDAYFKRIYG